VRQLAWLAATPKLKDDGVVESRQGRMDRLSDDPDYGLPSVSDIGYLVETLAELGYCQVSTNGVSAIAWHEIESWVRLSCSELHWREIVALRRLSLAYASEYNKTNGRDCPSPCIDLEKVADKVAGKVETLFSMLRRST